MIFKVFLHTPVASEEKKRVPVRKGPPGSKADLLLVF